MRKLALVLPLLIAHPALAVDHYEIDKEHTTVLFLVNHIGFSNMVGVFTKFSGVFSFDPKTPLESTVEMTLNPSGIRTSSSMLDSVLQRENFFNTDKFPDIRFVSTAITKTGENTGNVTGRLTMLGVTKPVTLHVHFNKADYHPITQNFIAGFSAEGTIKRSDFGMNYLVPMVSDNVQIMIEAEGIDIDRKNAERIKH